jgi:hypothetical protein
MRPAERELLPMRRRSETFNMTFGGQLTMFAVTVGYYNDGRVGEVFIDGAKSGTEMIAITRDGAVLLSLGLQYGVPLETMQHAVTRNADSTAATIIGAVIDRIIAHEEGG